MRRVFRLGQISLLLAPLALSACRGRVARNTASGTTPPPVPLVAPVEPLQPLPDAQGGARLPDALADSTWWRMIREFSEPGGYFRSENFVSNELGLQHVVARLQVTAPPGGVYVGVGPEQNFTYIAALKPRVAFIVDIRRQNLLQHLWYKAVFELSSSRAQFLTRLFARPLSGPMAATSRWSADTLISRLQQAPADSALFARTFREVRTHLTVTRGITLDSSDLATLHYIDSVFYQNGPELNYSSSGGAAGYRGGFRRMPTFAQVATATDSVGVNVGFLGSEAAYHTVRDLQRRNLIVPLVGNFAGPRTLRTVGAWLRDHTAQVHVFYTSNVEQYLFQQGDEWARFYANVGSMPLSTSARFIRSVTGGYGAARNGFLMTSLTSEIAPIVRDAGAGRLGGYGDVISRSR